MTKGNTVKMLLTGVLGGAIALGGSAIYQNTVGTNTNSSGTSTAKVSNVAVKVTTDTTKAIKKVSPAVVSVLNYQKQQASNSSDFYSQFFGGSSSNSENKDKETAQLAGEGSGVIYKKSDGTAYIVTNNHVIESNDHIEVLLSTGQKVKATVVGADSFTDLAVLKIDSKNVTATASFGDSSKATVGEPAITVGSPLGSQYANSATEGIVSALNRTVQMTNEENQNVSVNAIQTDAAINPGNSGGALINIEGQVIGITSSKIASSGGSSGTAVEGMGFAIPANDVVSIINKLEKDGKVSRPAIGVSMIALSNLTADQVSQLKLPKEVTGGVWVNDVQQGLPAAAAGLKSGDVITKLGDTELTSSVDLQTALYKYAIGDKVEVTYYRDGAKKTANLHLTKENSDLKMTPSQQTNK